MMKILIVALCVAFTLASNTDLEQEWKLWKTDNKKVYERDEEDYRRFVWEYNYKMVTEHNEKYALGHTTFTMAMNKFADMTNYEIRKQMNGFRAGFQPAGPVRASVDINGLPSAIDWRPKGYVTPVKDQKQCGSCWSFSATGALEGQNFNKTGKLPSLSEQNLIDCATEKYGNEGCANGYMNGAFQYVQDNGGIDSEASYPYEAKDGPCRFKRANVSGTDRTHVVVNPPQDETVLQQAVATIGPISVAIDASLTSFQMYHSGVYDDPRCSNVTLDHAVLVVGYGTYNGQDFWQVKNSWGTGWGNEGYIKMSRFQDNQCGIANNGTYPLV